MKIKAIFYLTLISFSSLFIACENEDEMDDNNTSATMLKLNIDGLEDVGSDYQYENWIIVDGAPVSAGLFTVNANGELSQTSFEVDQNQLNRTSAYVLTIEPNPDPDPAPSSVHILGGDFDGSSAPATVSHPAAIGHDFTNSIGQYILATPTDGGITTDENSGVWFFDPMASAATLDLPDLPAGWIYEGWAVINGQPVSTGTFSAVDQADNAAPFSGSVDGPPYPGEDFLENAPSGLTFPTDLSNSNIVISIEPVPDNSPAPFTLKPWQ